MITIKHPEYHVRNGNLQSILHSKQAIQALAAQLVAGQVEAHLDMISDAGAKEYNDFNEVAGCVAGAKDTVKDYVEDLLADFRTTLYEQIELVKVTTTAVILKPGSDVDADVTVELE